MEKSMSHFKSFGLAVCAALCMLGVGSASATMIDCGNGLIYDNVLNITWLQDAKYAKTDLKLGGTDAWRDAIIADVGTVESCTLDRTPNVDFVTANGNGPYTGWMNELGYMFFVVLLGCATLLRYMLQ
jgi:hypothetical protein